MRIGAIDIGSNAARLLVVDVTIDKQRKKVFDTVDFIRLPLRLGFDVFETGEIGKVKSDKFTIAMDVFKKILDFYEVQHFRACATSAMRDARNSTPLLSQVKQSTGIPIHVISGIQEADLINKNHIAENMDRSHGYLYINVGGGSTELVFFIHGKVQYKRSFDIGTIRILKNMITKAHWKDIKKELKAEVKSKLSHVAIGSGGNINEVFALSKKKEGKPLPLSRLEKYHKDLNVLSIEDRIHKYQLHEDRANVIVPALQIYIKIMRWCGIKKIYVPNIGVANGIVHALYDEVCSA